MTTAALLGVDSCPMEGFDLDKVTEILADEGILDTEHFGISVMVGFLVIELKNLLMVKFVKIKMTSLVGIII